MLVWARINSIATISLAGTLSLAILFKGSTITLPVPRRRDFLKRVLAVIRSWSHLGRALGLELAAIKGTGMGRCWDVRVLVEIAETDAAGEGVALLGWMDLVEFDGAETDILIADLGLIIGYSARYGVLG